MKKKYAIGVDIGGSHITSAAVNMETNEIIKESLCTQPVDSSSDAEKILSDWVKAIGESIGKVGSERTAGIGFAMPGPFDYAEGICLIKGVPKYEKLYGTHVGNEIRKRLNLSGQIPVRFMNDASAFAVGEAWVGQMAGHTRIFAITLGTGFGSAFIDSGIPVVDRDDVPEMGCVYYLPYKEGIADEYFSTRWFVNSYKKLTGKNVPGVKELAEMAPDNDIVRGMFHTFGSNLAEFSGPWLKKFGAEALVMGGNISHAYPLFRESLDEGFHKQDIGIKTGISVLKEDAALLGSARLIDGKFFEKIKSILPKM